MRVCRFCRATEEATRFYDEGSVAGIAAGSCCQPCWVAKATEWRRKNSARWNMTRHRSTSMGRLGITSEQYDAVYVGASCAGCGDDGSSRRLVIDHDHGTGAVRGALCHSCNRTLGTARDRPDVLRALASYIEAHSGNRKD